MFEVRRYTAEQLAEWNKYVAKARNATFLFNRGYMDYHADRFHDYSIMFYKNGKLHSLLPAHQVGTELYSHYGLTYGGLIMDINVTIADTCELFNKSTLFSINQFVAFNLCTKIFNILINVISWQI